MRQSSRNIRLLIRLSIAVSLLASQAAVGAVPCVLPKTRAPDAVPGPVVDCRDAQGSLRTGKCVKGDKTEAVAPLLALDMPPPLPVLIVARAEDVAEWHAEIFEHLSQAPLVPPGVRGNCSLLLL